MTLVNAAEGPSTQTSANRETNTLVPGSFPQEIGARADRLAGATGSRLTRVSSLALIGALDAAIALEGAGSFPDRHCEYCDEPLIRHFDESIGRFELRRFCCLSCSISGRSPNLSGPPVCQHCNSLLVRRSNETPSNFRRRKYCNPECCQARVNNLAAERQARTFAQNQAIRAAGGAFPRAKDAGREAALYGSERYDAPGRTMVLAPAKRISPIFGTHVYQESTAAMASG